MSKPNDLFFLQVADDDHPLLQSFFLRIGHWKRLFEEVKCKWIIAKALNSWVKSNQENKFELTGYVITDAKLGLVLKIRTKDLPISLNRFFEVLNKEIMDSLENKEMEIADALGEEMNSGTNVQFHNLFETKSQMSPFLVRLLTGRKIKLPYYNVRLVRLEERIHKYNFCSAMDYSGAIGPVETKLLNKEELDRLERIINN